MMKNKNTGERYYKVEDGKAVVGTIIKMFEDGNVKMRFEDGSSKVIDLSKENMTKLKPDGYLVIALVSMGEPVEQHGYDVIVSLNRKQDVENSPNNVKPWAVCRQNINNFYMSGINTSETQYVGLSCCSTTIPEGVEFPNTLLSCHKVVDSTVISIYFDSTLDDIIRCINAALLQKIDSTLYAMYNTMKDSNFIGFNKSLKDLLYGTNFMTDVRLGYDIETVDFEIGISENDIDMLDNATIEKVEDHIKHRLFNAWAIPYDKYTNLKKIEIDKILVVTPTEKFWVIGYLPGEYVNRPYMQLEDHQELETMRHSFPI